nr:expressed protein [Hymenolepis microstoma]
MTFPKREFALNPTLRARINLEIQLHEICERSFSQFCKKYADLKWEPIDIETNHVPSFYLPKYGLDKKRDKVKKEVRSKAFQRLNFIRSESLFDQPIAHPNALNSLPEFFTQTDIPVECEENSSPCASVSMPLEVETELTTNSQTLENSENKIEFIETFEKKLHSVEQLIRPQPLEEKNTEDL